MFWNTINRPIIGLSPMDGVTDAPMRFIAKKYGKADITYTEFVSAEGLWRVEKRGEMDNKMWQDLRFDRSQGPNIAQIFGSDPESFYESAKIICRLGFDGIDINMGCPSPGLEKRGGGAGLIRDKCNAVEVVEATRRGVRDFFSVPQSTQSSCSRAPVLLRSRGMIARDFVSASEPLEKKNTDSIPVSVKTRIGSDKPDEGWWRTLAGMNLPAVAMHGRTFKQLYSGEADWEVLAKAAEVIRESGTLFLGNGDIIKIFDQFRPIQFFGSAASTSQGSEGVPAPKLDSSCTDSQKFVIELKGGKVLDLEGRMDGVLIGRGAIGNPWALRRCELRPVPIETSGSTEAIPESEIAASPLALPRGYSGSATRNDGVSVEERLGVAVEHTRKFEEMLPEQKFFVMRKHLVGYASGFDGAVDLRKKLVMTNSADEVEKIVKEWSLA